MSIITAKGKAAKESANKSGGVDLKEVFIRLKDGDSVRVRLMSEEDFIEYLSHGYYGKGVFTQPCIEPTGESCAMCEAAQYEGEKDKDGNPVWKQLNRRKRYLFGFADIDKGMFRVFDASKKQAQSLMAAIEEYSENIGEVAFTLKRVGSGTDTTYTLNPILKLKKDNQKKFDEFDGQEITEEFFEFCLQARSRSQQIVELKKAGFPLNEVFTAADIDAAEKEEKRQEEKKQEKENNDNGGNNEETGNGEDANAEAEKQSSDDKNVDPNEVF